MNPWMLLIGIVFIFIGFILIVVSSLPQKTEIKSGGVVLIGPVPLIFGTDKETIIIASVLAIVIMILALLLLRAF